MRRKALPACFRTAASAAGLLSAGIAVSLLLASCFREGAVDGGTETETTLAGRITDASGRPSERAVVLLLPADYNPVSRTGRVLQRTTDADGRYAFSGIDTGDYNIQAEGMTSEAALVRGIRVAVPPPDHDSTQAVPDAVLHPAGRILIHWNLLPYENGWVYIPGTTVAARIASFPDSGEGLILDGVPAGVYTDIRATSGGTLGENLLADTLRVLPGDTVRAPPFAAWLHSRRLLINTADAGVTEDVAGYPLLLRLDAANFQFGDAALDGSDLRFTTSDHRPLPFEIVRWDAAGKSAEIWIRLDTAYGGRRDQLLHLHYGNPGAAPQSSGPGVFGSRDGFAAVWHLDELSPGAGAVGAHKDATANGHHGDDRTGSAPHPGIAGRGQGFDGVDDFIDLPASNLLLPSADRPFTMTAWIWAVPSPDWDTGEPRILDIHRSDTNGSSIAIGMGRGQRAFYYNHADSRFRFSGDTVSLQQWHQVGLVYEGGAFRFYLDGEPASDPVPGNLLPGGSYRAKIGKYGDTYAHAFPGIIDEARIHATGRSAAWLRLDYASQKPGSTVVSILP